MMRKILFIGAIYALFIPFCLKANTDSLSIFTDSVENAFHYETGTIQFPSCHASLKVPQGLKYLNAKQSIFVLSELWGNPKDSTILGLLVPENKGLLSSDSWAFTLSFDDMGYVKDDDAEDIKYDKLLEDMQKETRDANPQRIGMGYPSIELVGWASQPFYDSKLKILHWAKELKFGEDSINTLNYNLRILSKDGVFVANAVASMTEFNEVRPALDKVATCISFDKGFAYSEFNPKVDNVAAWTIGGLVAGKVLAKVGFFAIFAKFFKIIFVALAAAGGAIWKFFGGKNKKNESSISPSKTEF